MGLLNVPKMVDYRNQVTKHKTKQYSNRSNGINSITDITIHHSLTLQKLAGSNAKGYSNFHVNSLGWPGIGYTYVIEKDGTIKYVNDIEKRTYHVGDHNNYAVGVLLSGDFRYENPTKEQEESLRNLVAALKKRLPNYKRTKGHSDYSGYEWKQCPVFDYKKVLAGGTEQTIVKPKKPASGNVKGQELSKNKEYVHLPATAKTWRTYRLNVQPIKKNSDWMLTPSRYGGLTYEILGKPYADVVTIQTSQGKRNIYVGKGTGARVSKGAETSVNTSEKTTSKSTNKTFKVGQKVKIKSSAKYYSRTKNVAIPAKHKNKTLTVQQVGKTDLLIKELFSWVKISDVQ